MNLTQLANKIVTLQQQIAASKYDNLLRAREAGRLLAESRAKILMNHSDRYKRRANLAIQEKDGLLGVGFAKWVRKNCGMSLATARGYLKIYQNWDKVKACVSITAALKTLFHTMPCKSFSARLSLIFNQTIRSWTQEERKWLVENEEILKIYLDEIRKSRTELKIAA